MAVGAGLGVGGEVGEALGVDEGEEPEAKQNAQRDGGEDEHSLGKGQGHEFPLLR